MLARAALFTAWGALVLSPSSLSRRPNMTAEWLDFDEVIVI